MQIWWVYMQIRWVYAPVGFCAPLFIFVFVPDCKGKSLGEVDWVFKNGVSMRHFTKHQVPDLYQEHTNKTFEEGFDGRIPHDQQITASYTTNNHLTSTYQN